MLNELDPRDEKLSLRLKIKVSIAVSIPTKQMIPTAIIIKVSVALVRLFLMAEKAILIFSSNNIA